MTEKEYEMKRAEAKNDYHKLWLLEREANIALVKERDEARRLAEWWRDRAKIQCSRDVLTANMAKFTWEGE